MVPSRVRAVAESLSRHPVRMVPVAFLVAGSIGTLLLSMPFATADGRSAPFVTALFTAASAVCVTGLIVVDTATYWSTGGHLVILALCQVGGFGILTLGTLLAMVVFRRLGLRSRLLAAAEMRSQGPGGVTRVVVRLALMVLALESMFTVVLTLRLLSLGEPVGRAAWYGFFHAISAFNNAGFTLYPDGLVRFVADPVVNTTVIVAIVLGAIGTPVLLELRRELLRPRDWSVHTKLTLYGTGLLLLVGFVATAAIEWDGVLRHLPPATRLLAAMFHSAQHTAGFNTVDMAEMDEATKAVTIGLMFVGGGSASTAGGIKISTFMLLAFVLRSEILGEADVTVGRRRVPAAAQRQAVAIALLGIAAVGVGTLFVLLTSSVPFEDALYETTSAAATVGLSSGAISELPDPARLMLVVLMYLGRVGSVTAASALALRDRPRLYRLPEERPIVG